MIRTFIEVRLVEETELSPGNTQPYRAYRTLDRRELVQVPNDGYSGQGWLLALEVFVHGTTEIETDGLPIPEASDPAERAANAAFEGG